MVVFEKTSWLKLLFTMKGSVLHKIWKRVLASTLFATVITLLFDFELLPESFDFTTLPFTLIGLALAIFLGFRNNSSYDRWWEGRKLWGRMINTTRTVTRQTMTLVDASYADPSYDEESEDASPETLAFHREQIHRLICYLNALRHHLRDERDFSDCEGLVPQGEYARITEDLNAPIGLLHTMGERYRDAWRKGWLDTYHLPILEGSLALMTDIQGGCERIKKTPIPFAYTVLMHRIVGIYCFTLSFGVHATIGDLTPIVVFMISYSFFGLDAIGDEIEEPFGHDPNDLSLGAFTNMLEREARYRLGESELPAPVEPRANVLS
jgi:putative membrane protein